MNPGEEQGEDQRAVSTRGRAAGLFRVRTDRKHLLESEISQSSELLQSEQMR